MVCSKPGTNIQYQIRSFVGLRNDTEAASNTALTLLDLAHIINHIFTVYKSACANIKVGVAAKLQKGI